MDEADLSAVNNGDHNDNDSESSDYDEGPFEVRHPPPNPREWHNDHWDQVINDYNPYAACDWPGEDWFTTHIATNSDSVSNDTLRADPVTQHWLETLAHLQRPRLPSLQMAFTPPDPMGGGGGGQGGALEAPRRRRHVPLLHLFRDDDTGDEYQLRFHLGSSLAHIWCPVASPQLELDMPTQTHPLLLVRYRLPQPQPEPEPEPEGTVVDVVNDPQDDESPGQPETPRPLLLPHFLRPLGTLAIRTTARYPDHSPSPEPLTETTDYNVMLDVGSDALSVWLLCSRRRLRDRANEAQGCVNPLFPIFRGQMLQQQQQEEEEEEEEGGNGDGRGKYGYDVACILDSVRRLGTCRFPEACALVGRTRAVADPGKVLGLGLDAINKWKEIVRDQQDST